MNKNLHNAILVVGTALFIAGTVGTVIKRLWKS